MSAAFESDPVAPGAGLALRHDGAVEFVRAFEHRKDLVRRGFALLREADYVATKDERFADPDDAVEALEREGWQQIAERFELQRVMSVKAHREFWEQLNKGEMPPITVDNVLAFVAGIRSQIPDMHRDAVLEVHDWLRPHEWNDAHRFKTNTELEIGKRVVLTHMVEPNWNGSLHVRYSSGYLHDPRLRLLSLERVLLALDGRGMIAADDYSEIQKQIDGPFVDGHRLPGKTSGETELFRYRACKNGNLHLQFKRLDLLARFNAIAGGKTLKPEAGITKSPRGTKAKRPPPDARPAAARGAEELAFFETGQDLAARVVALAEIRAGHEVLEPSAGEGALAMAARAAGGRVSCVEIHPVRAEHLRRLGFDVTEGDFLALDPRPFSTLIMNPPFARAADVHHVAAALRWLVPGGALIAIMSAGAMFRADACACELRRDVAERGGRFEPLPAGSFEPATSVNTCLCIVPRAS